MKAVFRHEVSSHFTSLTGYVFGAFILLFAGIYTMVYNIDAALSNFEYALGSMTLVFIVAVPILTMRVISEERRQKTDQLLYSLPLTMTNVVLGKFLALLVMLLIPTAIIGIYPTLLAAYGNIYLPTAYATLLGFFLLGAALISIGMFISSLTESQAMAAGLCFVVMLLNYFIADLSSYVGTSAFTSCVAFGVLIALGALLFWVMTKNRFASLVLAAVGEGALIIWYTVDNLAFSNAFPTLMGKLSLFEQFYTFVNGVLDLRSVIYLVSVCSFFVYLTVQSLEKRRWSE